MRCAHLVLALLILCAGSLPVLAKPPGSANCKEHGRGVRICTLLEKGALKRLGRSTKWRIWIEGDGSPIQVRLHNGSPGVVRLEGGNDQIVHIKGRHRELRRKVTAIGYGASVLEARPYSASPKREAANIAAALAPRLKQIEARFVERRTELSQGSAYPAEAVVDLMNKTEAELLEVLNYPELAGLQDYVRTRFRKALSSLGEMGKAEPFAAERAVAVVASLGAAPSALRMEKGQQPSTTTGKSVHKASADNTFDQALRTIQRLYKLAVENDMLTSLCVTSGPETKARFRMRLQGVKDWMTDKSTPGEYREIFRGLYVYRIEGKGYKPLVCVDPDREECSLIDLVDYSEPIFHCDFSDGFCERRSEPLPMEACRGNER